MGCRILASAWSWHTAFLYSWRKENIISSSLWSKIRLFWDSYALLWFQWGRSEVMIIYGHMTYLSVSIHLCKGYPSIFPSFSIILLSLCQWSTRTHQKWAERRCIVQENMNQEVTTWNNSKWSWQMEKDGKGHTGYAAWQRVFSQFSSPSRFSSRNHPFFRGAKTKVGLSLPKRQLILIRSKSWSEAAREAAVGCDWIFTKYHWTWAGWWFATYDIVIEKTMIPLVWLDNQKYENPQPVNILRNHMGSPLALSQLLSLYVLQDCCPIVWIIISHIFPR